MPALAWLTDSRAAAVGDGGEDRFEVRALLDQAGTLYLLGAEDGVVAPLIAALTAEIAHQARTMAAGMRGGRLDPPLTIALDEAALVCPVPLDRWTADMGGRNITIHISVQSRAQLRQWSAHWTAARSTSGNRPPAPSANGSWKRPWAARSAYGGRCVRTATAAKSSASTRT
jgi:hypothetical protein